LIIEGVDYNASIHETPDNIVIAVKGLRNRVQYLTASDITAILFINELTESETDIPIRIILPEGVSLVGSEPVITISELELQAEDEAVSEE